MQITEEIRNYWDLRSSGFSDAVMHEMSDRGDEMYATVERMTGAPKGSRVLDVGCGPGILSLVMSAHGMDVVGIDYSEEMVKKAVANAEEHGLKAEFIRMDAQDMSFDDCSFDLVVSRDLLWNLTEPEKAYGEIVRVLRPGGKAMVIDGNYYLHIFDERYARRKHIPKDASRPDYHSKYNQDGVDFRIIADIAKDLPLSREERPAWDLKVLGKLGISDVRYSLSTAESGDERIITRFTEVFAKGGSDALRCLRR